MHVLVRRAHGRAIGEAFGDPVESFEELYLFDGCEDADATQRVNPGLAGGHVLRPEAVVDGEGAVEGVERLGGS